MKRIAILGLLLAPWMIAVRANEKTSAAKSAEAAAGTTSADSARTQASARRVFELRTYITNEGKLDDLHKRFHDHTCRLLKKHGAELIGFWTPLDEKDGKGGKLIYLVAFPSREAAKTTWESFGKDPEWQRVYEESHKNGKLVKTVETVFLEPTDYSEMK
jgi:type II secretory pathway pseudopilin PulG